jgi:hypothetical protein
LLAGKLIVSLDDAPLSVNEQTDSIVVRGIDFEKELLGEELRIGSSKGRNSTHEVAVTH